MEFVVVYFSVVLIGSIIYYCYWRKHRDDMSENARYGWGLAIATWPLSSVLIIAFLSMALFFNAIDD